MPAPDHKRSSLGALGEKLAREYLEEHGYRIVTGNYRVKVGEIDLVAEDGDVLVFVEVKTRNGPTHGLPVEAVTSAKQVKLSKVALQYLNRYHHADRPARFDVVGVLFRAGHPVQIELIKNAFDLCYGF